MRYCDFSRRLSPPSWILKLAKFYSPTVPRMPSRNTELNFIKISHFIVEIMWFLEFSTWRCRHIGFLKSQNLSAGGVHRVETHQHAKFHQNRSVGCEDIRFFQLFIFDLFGAKLDHPIRVLGSLYLVTVDVVVLIICKYRYLARMAE